MEFICNFLSKKKQICKTIKSFYFLLIKSKNIILFYIYMGSNIRSDEYKLSTADLLSNKQLKILAQGYSAFVKKLNFFCGSK